MSAIYGGVTRYARYDPRAPILPGDVLRGPGGGCFLVVEAVVVSSRDPRPLAPARWRLRCEPVEEDLYDVNVQLLELVRRRGQAAPAAPV